VKSLLLFKSWCSYFRGFRGSLKQRKLKSNEIQFSHWLFVDFSVWRHEFREPRDQCIL